MHKEFWSADVDGNHVSSPRILIADGTSDIANFPGLHDAAYGSMAFIISPPSVYMLNSNGDWVSSGGSGGGGSSSAVVGTAVVGSAKV